MRPYSVLAVMLTALITLPARADEPWDMFDRGKLLATGGVSEVEGTGGGGIANWAMITGYGTRDGIGVNAHYTAVPLPDYKVCKAPASRLGCSTGWSFSMRGRNSTPRDVGTLAPGLGKGFTFHQNIFGAKLKLIGDAVYDQDSWLPQISIGLQHMENDRGAVIAAVGGKNSVGTDYYIAASKLFLAESLLVDVTLRETRANQFGILGFGGDKA